MSRKKSKHRHRQAAVPTEILAEGSGAAPEEDAEEVVAAPAEEAAEVSEPVADEIAVEAIVAAPAEDAVEAVEAKPAKRAKKTKAKTAPADEEPAELAMAAAEDAIVAEAVDGETLHADDDSDPEPLRADETDGGEPLDAEGEEVGQPLELAGERDPSEGDDVVGEPITDEAGVEAALLPSTLSAVQLRHLIEALIFATDKPVTLQRLRQLTRISDVTRIEAALAELHDDYKDRGIALTVVSGGYQFRTNTSFSSWVQQLIAGRPVRLSRAQLETLAIVAYRQPITRPEIDEIRGVDSSATLRLLLDRSLIRVLGKREEVGRPTLYGTTKEFLDFFSLGDLRELPTLREYSELTAESRQVMSDRLGVPLDENGELIEPESELLDDGDFTSDNASIVDSILAEHAAAEAAAEGRGGGDVSALAEAAMSGGRADAFSDAVDESEVDSDADAAAMSLSGDASTFESSRSEARSYVDALRSKVLGDADDEIDDVEVKADEPSVETDDVELKADEAHEPALGESTIEATGEANIELAPDEAASSESAIEATGDDDIELAADEVQAPALEESSIEAARDSEVELAADEAHSTSISDPVGEGELVASDDLEMANIDLGQVGDPDEAELAAEAALEAANAAHERHAAPPTEAASESGDDEDDGN